jgi:chemotaxis protein methyltransferase CheR
MLDDSTPPMSVEEFRLCRDLIHDHCGIYFQDDSQHLLERRLGPRLQARSLADWGEYYRFLRYHTSRKEELEEIVERITTNETYFFREMYQLDALRDEILPELHARKPRGKHLTIWSAGCSSGEEAYTAAILIIESGLFADWDVRVFGSDISRRVLAQARKGAYGPVAFRGVDERHRRRWFREVEGKQQIREEVRALCSFGRINLVDSDQISVVGEVDVVLCRNVLIYFDHPARRRAVEAFQRKLVPGGYLLLGHSESLLNVSTAFELVHLKTAMVYRKPVRAAAAPGAAAKVLP